jgi:hypothetical protein
MIVGVHGGSHSGNPGSGGRVGPLQPRGRAAGDGRQAHSPYRASAPGAGAQPTAPCALAGWNGAVDAWLAAAGRGAAAGLARDRAADDGRRAARAAVLWRAHARRARRAARARRDVRDRDRRGRHRGHRSGAQHEPYAQPHRDGCARRTWAADAAAVRGQPRSAAGRVADDGGGGARLRLERRRDEAVLRRSLPGAPMVRARLGALDGRRLGGRGAQRDERPADAARDPGGAGGVRDSDGRAGGVGAAAAG